MKSKLFSRFFCLFVVLCYASGLSSVPQHCQLLKGYVPSGLPSVSLFVVGGKHCETDEKCHRRVQSFISLSRSDQKATEGEKKTLLITSVDFELDFLVSPHSVNCMHLSFPLLCFNVIARLQHSTPGESSMPISKSCSLVLSIEIIF